MVTFIKLKSNVKIQISVTYKMWKLFKNSNCIEFELQTIAKGLQLSCGWVTWVRVGQKKFIIDGSHPQKNRVLEQSSRKSRNASKFHQIWALFQWQSVRICDSKQGFCRFFRPLKTRFGSKVVQKSWKWVLEESGPQLWFYGSTKKGSYFLVQK